MRPPAKLLHALAGLPPVPYADVLTRYVDFEDYSASPAARLLYDEGPPRNGQRYTPKGGARAIYAAEGVACALAEATGDGLRALNPPRASTSLQLNLDVRLNAVLDLGNHRIRRKLGTTARELKEPWRGVAELTGVPPLTWTLGQLAFDTGRFDGIRYPSAKAPRSFCVVVFTARLGPGAHVRAVRRSGGSHEELTGAFELEP